MNKILLNIIILGILFTSCENVFLEPSPASNSQVAVFDEFWNIYNEKYAMFEIKDVDWQAAYDVNRPLVTENTTDEELFEIIGNMILLLRDGHSSLFDVEKEVDKTFDIVKGAPINFEENSYLNFLRDNRVEDVQLFMEDQAFFVMLRNNIGYIAIPTFDAELTEEEINNVLQHFEDTQGIILDVRNNTGGDPAASSRLARHFTNQEFATGFERFKIGPNPREFADNPAFVRPADEGLIYTKPVMVLTNALCYSATTTIIYQTNPLPNVTFIGSRTGGGSGSVSDGFLSNGWQYSLSSSEFIDFENRHLDDGFDPDIEVFINEGNENVDEVILRAMEELRE